MSLRLPRNCLRTCTRMRRTKTGKSRLKKLGPETPSGLGYSKSMQTEIEAKFLGVEPADVRARLKKAGAACRQPMKLMRRVVFDNETMRAKSGFVRVRDEGYRITMTYKQYDEMSLTGAKEIEFTVSNYDAALAFCEAAGIRPKSAQE